MEITSPMAGTFYTAPAPGEPAFAKVGDTVTKGQCIGIIEAMKVRRWTWDGVGPPRGLARRAAGRPPAI